jgi:hypothetical protein
VPPKALKRKGQVRVEPIYCRKCMKRKPPTEFYIAVDNILDSNNYMSVCKDCITLIYTTYARVEHSWERGIYRTCQTINMIYSETAIAAVRTQIESEKLSSTDTSVFGQYKAKLISTMRGNGVKSVVTRENVDLTFQGNNAPFPVVQMEADEFDDAPLVLSFWGEGFSKADYAFLEQELANFKATHKSDTYAEIVLLKEVCYKLLEIQKKRNGGLGSTAAGVKELQALMSTLAISPDKVNQASSGRSMETFGQWIKDIEMSKPAEYFADKSIYKDVDNIEEYGEKYIVDSLRRFMTESTAFGTDELEKLVDEDASTEG